MSRIIRWARAATRRFAAVADAARHGLTRMGRLLPAILDAVGRRLTTVSASLAAGVGWPARPSPAACPPGAAVAASVDRGPAPTPWHPASAPATAFPWRPGTGPTPVRSPGPGGHRPPRADPPRAPP